MASSVVVRIGADVTDLVAELALAKKEVSASAAEMQKFAGQVMRGGENADAARAALASWAAETEHARSNVVSLQDRLEKARKGIVDTGKSAGLTGYEMKNLGMQLNDAATMALSGSSAFQIAATQGGQVLQILQGAQGGIVGGLKSIGQGMMGLVSPANIGFTAMIAGAAAAATAFVMYKSQTQEMLTAVTQGMAQAVAAGNADVSMRGLETLFNALKKLKDVSAEDATAIESSFAKLSDPSGTLSLLGSKLIEPLSRALGETIPDAAKKLTAALANPESAGKNLVASLHGVTAAEQDNLQTVLASGNLYQQRAAIVEIVTRLSLAQAEATKKVRAENLGAIGSFLELINVFKLLGPSFSLVGSELQDQEKKIRELGSAARATTSILRDMKRSPDEAMKIGGADVAQINPLSKQADDIAASIARVKGELKDLNGGEFGRLQPMTALEGKTVRQLEESLGVLEDRYRKVTDAQSGGNAQEQLALDLSRRSITAAQDKAAAKLAEAAAIDQDAAGLHDRAEQNKLFKQAADLRAEAARITNENKAAEESYAAAVAKSAGNTAEYTRRANQALETRKKLTAPGTSERANIEAQQFSNSDALKREDIAAAKIAEAARNQIALDGVRYREELVRQEAADGKISRQEELQQLLAIMTQRRQIEASHFDFLLKANANDRLSHQSTLAAKAVATDKYALEQAKLIADANRQIVQDYRSAFEEIGSSVSSSIMGMIQGTMRMRDMARNVVLQMISMFVQAGVRMAANWLAHTAAQVTATAAGETAKTTAVAAGVAARTGLESAGAAAAGAATFSAIFKSIMASAAETFAGIFGFLSPVMGPAAAGPAGAGMATVAAVAGSFAVGAWELPRDMIAQVHQGEMIIPAGPAANMRAALSGSGSGAGAVHVHHATSFNVQAIDAAGVRQFLKSNSKQILRAINEGVQSGSHLGLSKLGSA